MMQLAAILWHVSLLAPPDRKGLALGMVGLVRFVPIILLSVVGGVVADAHDRRRTMLITQMLRWRSLSGLLATDAHAPRERSGWSTSCAALCAARGAFDGPARQSLFPNLVPRAVLPNAISLNTILFQVASVVGPSLGGIVIAASAWRLGLRDQRGLVPGRDRRAAR